MPLLRLCIFTLELPWHPVFGTLLFNIRLDNLNLILPMLLSLVNLWTEFTSFNLIVINLDMLRSLPRILWTWVGIFKATGQERPSNAAYFFIGLNLKILLLSIIRMLLLFWSMFSIEWCNSLLGSFRGLLRWSRVRSSSVAFLLLRNRWLWASWYTSRNHI